MAKFRKKPVVVDAVRLTERTEIKTLEGTMIGNPGDWLITGVAGEKYPCKDDIFRATYEPADVEDRKIRSILDREGVNGGRLVKKEKTNHGR
jgi:hypothetical protein